MLIYLFPFQESVSELILNFGVRINSLFLPKYPCKTAETLCNEKPNAMEKNEKNNFI